MNTTKIITQIKRELWENKGGFIYTPLIITGLYLFIGLGVIIYFSESIGAHHSVQDSALKIECNGNPCVNGGGPELFNAVTSVGSSPDAFGEIILGAMYVNCALLSVVLSIALTTYILRCLFDDRKNNEILFWRSMPVSETTNVLVKLGMQLLVAPFIVLLINELVTVAYFVAGLIVFASHGVPLSYLLASVANGKVIYIPLQICYENIFGLLMLMPVIGYFLFSSALAKKSPFLTSALIPVILIIVDAMLNKFLGVQLGIIHVLGWYGQALINVKDTYILQHALVLDSSMLLPFVVCISIGSLFVSGAIWLRNNRYEI